MTDTLPFDPDTVWLDHVQPVGLVVASSLLKELGLAPQQQTQRDTAEVAELMSPEDGDGPALSDPWAFASRILKWEAGFVAGAPGGDPLPEDLHVVLPEYDTTLAPTWAVRAAGGVTPGWQLLVRIEPAGVEPDARNALVGWEATPHQRFERLLRETGAGAGVLITDNELRLVYAPRGETSGWLGFPLRALRTVAGRPMLAGLKLILGRPRLFTAPEPQRLPALLRASREAQAHVSTTLSGQVLGALHELLRGLSAAEPELVKRLAAERPQHLYEGLLTILLRLVFILYAEDRDLIPSRTDATARDFYQQGYSVRGLHARLLEDAARNPDTMEERRGAWGRLLATFRLVHTGDGSGWICGRGGKLFDPDTFPFLEGRTDAAAPPRVALVSDGAVLRILDGLLTLKGERLSYRTLDVEQIGSVYETVMGFTVEVARGPVLAIKAGKNNRTPVFVDLAELASAKPAERLKRLKESANRSSLSRTQEAAVKAAKTTDELAAALEPIADERASPQRRVAPAGTPILQPTDERRRTGSHYTPRSLTEPIVRHALEPAFERLGEDAMPDQVLDLKVCDPAMGSGAFLVEACRALAARLVKAWARWPETRPVIPPDEDEELHARRLVAQRCLYGVDKNRMAVDLARLSLWLATLARDHEFTFLDHALKPGDSLVGLTRAQIAALHWDEHAPPTLFAHVVRQRFQEALEGRNEIREAPDDVSRAMQESRFHIVEERLDHARMIGDAVIAAFFSADKPHARETARMEIEMAAGGPPEALWAKLNTMRQSLRTGEHQIRPFHWELEFPEVFARENPGFDGIVGNPPFIRGKSIGTNLGNCYRDFVVFANAEANASADICAFFFRRAFDLIRRTGACGLIATKTIAKGSTRTAGLRWICNNGGVIYSAVRRVVWPGEASVIISIIHIEKGGDRKLYTLDGHVVDKITAFLFSIGENEDPAVLMSNCGVCFNGCNLASQKFIFDDSDPKANPIEDIRKLIKEDSKNSSMIFPYYGGEEINSSHDISTKRFAIYFGTSSFDRAKTWPSLLQYVKERVKPQRDKANRKSHRENWWLYGDPRPKMMAAISRLDRYLACVFVSKYLGFVWLDAKSIASHNVGVFANDTDEFFCVVQSRIHEIFGTGLSSGLEDRPGYRPTNGFLPFPFPSDWEGNARMAKAGREYYDLRSEIMIKNQQGLTDTYNRFHDPEEKCQKIKELRELHAEMDRVVLDAYGWNDIPLGCDFLLDHDLESDEQPDKRKPWRYRWPDGVRDEVLARLLALNATRAAEEMALGLAPTGRLGADEDEESEEIE
jgi:hypothetical protein